MFIGEYIEKVIYQRRSKKGTEHSYYRNKTITKFRCDNCDREFTRPRGKMNPQRLNNNHFHVCENCDAKRFAQKKGVEKKQIWDLSASSSQDISKL